MSWDTSITIMPFTKCWGWSWQHCLTFVLVTLHYGSLVSSNNITRQFFFQEIIDVQLKYSSLFSDVMGPLMPSLGGLCIICYLLRMCPCLQLCVFYDINQKCFLISKCIKHLQKTCIQFKFRLYAPLMAKSTYLLNLLHYMSKLTLHAILLCPISQRKMGWSRNAIAPS